MSEERRAVARPTVDRWTGVIAIIYTIGFMVLAGLLYFYPLPETNKDALLYLFGILSGIELTIIAFFFGGSKTAEETQRATEQSKARSDIAMQEIAKSVPVAAAVAAGAAVNGVVTAAPVNPATGNTPAAEVTKDGVK